MIKIFLAEIKESSPSINTSANNLKDVENILRNELMSTTQRLSKETSIPIKLQYISFINQCIQAISSLQTIK